VDALALADRWLQAGAPDSLLQLLIERGEETGSQSAGQWKANGGSHLYSSSWQYCIRLHNKTLAATLALKYVCLEYLATHLRPSESPEQGLGSQYVCCGGLWLFYTRFLVHNP
jgi:hypothetical protein